MKIISMACVWPAFVARAKGVTRRQWAHEYAARWHAGDKAAVWDRSPRFKGNRIGVLELTAAPVWEPIAAMPDEDYEAEGIGYMVRAGVPIPAGHIIDFEGWRNSGAWYYTIRFDILEVEPSAEARLAELLEVLRHG
jgi:hypothetical protein